MGILHVSLLGSPQVCLDDHPCKFRIKRSEALLFYCLDSLCPVGRSQLCDLFWPGEEEKKARGLLSDAIWRLQNDIKQVVTNTQDLQEYLVCSRQTVAFNVTSAYRYDVKEFETFAQTVTEETPTGEIERALHLYRGKFLENFHIPHADADFDTWVSTRQQNLAKHYDQLLCKLSTRYVARGNYAAALPHLTRWLEDDPEELAIYGLLMICHACLGHKAVAAKSYQQYVQMTGNVLDAAPDTTLRQLHHALQHNQLGPRQIQALLTQTLQSSPQMPDAQLQATLRTVLKSIEAPGAPSPDAGYHRVLQRASAEAANHGCRLIGMPHLLLALCTEFGSARHATKSNVRMQLDEIVRTVRCVLGTDTPANQPPREYTLELQNLLQAACSLAQEAGQQTIAVSHLWSALLQASHVWLGKVFEHYGVTSHAILAALE